MLMVVLFLPAGLNAGVLFSESFSYADGALVSVAQGRWKTHSGAAGPAEVASGALELSEKRTQDVSAPFPSGMQGPDQTAALYASFTAVFSGLPSGKGGYFAHFKDAAATTGMRCRVFATTNGAAPGKFRVGIASASSAASSVIEQDLSLGASYRLVCRMTLADNVCTLWVNPASEKHPGATSSDKAATVKSATAFAFRQSRSSGSGMGELRVDDLKVASTFAETLAASAPARVGAALPARLKE
jgi:hypothetical protein